MPSHADRVRRQYQHDFMGHRRGCPERPHCTCSYTRRMNAIVQTIADRIDEQVLVQWTTNAHVTNREPYAD